jgi:2-methylcitrate dehydratase PrpD
MENSTTIIDSFAKFLVNTKFDAIPSRLYEKVKLQILTSISAMKFSDWHPEARKIYEMEKLRTQGNQVSTVIALNKKLAPEEAAVVNAAYSMSLDYDDYILLGHNGYSSVITPLAFLEASNGMIGDLLQIAVKTNEIMGRVSLPCFFGPLNGQLTTFIHNIGAAAAVGQVKKFTEEMFRNALALSLYQPSFGITPGFYTEGCKLTTASTPLRAGIHAALYAEQGLEGPSYILEGHQGFFHHYAYDPIPEFAGDLGEAWLTDSLSYKRYPGTSYIAASVDSALGAIHNLNYEKITDVDEIEKILVETTAFSHTIEAISQQQPPKKLDAIRINFSVRNSVAYALLRGDLLPPFFKQEEIDPYIAQIEKLRDKIDVKQDLVQTLRILNEFPIVQLLKRMPKDKRKQFFGHLKDANRLPSTFVDKIKGGIRLLNHPVGKSVIKSFFASSKKPIQLRDVNTIDFPMYQSAKTTIYLKNGKKSAVDFPIPVGGSGTNFEDRKKWVYKRIELAFKRDAIAIARLLDDPTLPVKGFINELMQGN